MSNGHDNRTHPCGCPASTTVNITLRGHQCSNCEQIWTPVEPNHPAPRDANPDEPITDYLTDAGHWGLAGRTAACILRGERFPAAREEIELLQPLIDQGYIRTFRDGAERWVEKND